MNEDSSTRNKRIAKNILLLYARMILVMLVSLYTSRILLEALGISDYGIYNVVGGVVTMFTFMSAALGNASSRFITFSLGKGDINKTREVFNASRITHILISIVIVVLGETVGLWFLNTKMDIPADSMYAANWIYQFSIVTTVLAIVSVPYNATIIAHENMNVFAYVSIIDVLFKLGIVYIIKSFGGDRLILYGFLIMTVQLIDRIIYGIYCSRSYAESKFMLVRNRTLYKEIFSFSGWSMIGNLSVFGSSQGLNILLNIFFGPAVNAARGIAVQVQGAVKTLITNFQLAVTPQITKSYAGNDNARVISLLFSTCRISFYLMITLSLPVIIEIKKILSIWLVDVPDYTALFVRLMLIMVLIDTFERPITIAINSTGDIKKYQIYSCTCLLLTLPISYLLLHYGFPPQSVFIANISTALVAFVIELSLLRKKIPFSIKDFLYNVIFKILLVCIVAGVPSVALHIILPDSVWAFITIVFSSVVITMTASYQIGLNQTEKKMIRGKVKSLLSKFHGHK